MTFKEGYRLEKVYFENIYTLLNMLKSVDKNNVDMNTVKELLDNAIADNESIILIYKNLGELYSEVADNYSKLLADLEALKENLESWKDEINEKIDDLNNYIMSLIRDIEQRLDSLEQRMNDAEEAIDSLEDRMDIAEDDIDDLENNKQDKLTAGNGITIDNNNEISVDDSVVQPKLSEGFGIDIDSNNEISVDTNDVQEKLIAGQNITLTPDATDPTKTVIDAQGGSSYTAGDGIDIDSNNSIVNTKPSEFPYYDGTDILTATSLSYQSGTGAEAAMDNTDKYWYYFSLRNNETNISTTRKVIYFDPYLSGKVITNTTADDSETYWIGHVDFTVELTFTKGSSTKKATFIAGYGSIYGGKLGNGKSTIGIAVRSVSGIDVSGFTNRGYQLTKYQIIGNGNMFTNKKTTGTQLRYNDMVTQLNGCKSTPRLGYIN